MVVASIVKLSPTFKSKVLLLTLTLAQFKLTVTTIVLFSAAAYLSSPANETVIRALPALLALITPVDDTLTTLVSLET